MDEDMIVGLFVLIAWVVGIVASLGIAGFVCWGIYKLVIHFL